MQIYCKLVSMQVLEIIEGDCLKVLETFADNSVDHVITSPPYNIGRSTKTKSKQKAKYIGFKDNKKNYFDWSIKVIDELIRVSRGHVFYNVQANYYNKKDIYKLIGHYHKDIIQTFIWTKGHSSPGSEPGSISNFYEYIFAFSNDTRIKSNNKFTTNTIHTPIGGRYPGFHAVMHQDISDFLLENFTQEKDLILDPFLGSGTTAISCKKNNRDFIGIELVPEYIELAQQRIGESVF